MRVGMLGSASNGQPAQLPCSPDAVFASETGHRASVGSAIASLHARAGSVNERTGDKPNTGNVGVLQSIPDKLTSPVPPPLLMPMILLPTRAFDTAEQLADLPLASLASTPKPQPLSLTGSAWFLLRNGSGDPNQLTQGQLGGPQVGARVRLPALRLARLVDFGPTLRVSSPLSGAGKEVGLGLSVVRKGTVPIELIAERRIDLDRGGKSRWAVLVAGGTSEMPLAGGFHLDAFASAGIVGLKTGSPFIGASASVRRPVAQFGQAKLEAGVGIWGDAQQGLARLDAGPELTIGLGQTSIPLRISAQWRQRLAGHARPSSGPALTIGADF